MKDVAHANHNPTVVVNGQPGKAPIAIEAQVGTPVTLDAAGTFDPDRNALTYTWFFYAEAGSGVPAASGLRRPARRRSAAAETATRAAFPRPRPGGAPQPPDRA